ncbi:hypothetical protein BCR32DRAFT_208460 [Anaeromyces robustus]|uniref:Hydrophobin n=1 Tax=Anaeromyces robustus TaxID=1754192 RepID=A0A1Y1WTQ2_9FUNG|nr:hypothetical protein BCR32DRAFT_208460 [Anaeromyces robustus]|eukprot:ORX76903.1 hypothetical protein BCR32DRAFT_208460 [Anaeromyces robustus]
MYFNSKLILLVATTLPSTLAAVNGKCTGRNGICIATGTCNNYGGQSFTGKCPNDANNIRCCPRSMSRSTLSQCKNQNRCNGTVHSGICSGGNDRKCCLPSSTSCQSVGGVCNVLNKRDDKFYDPINTLFLDKLCPGDNKCCVSLTKQ